MDFARKKSSHIRLSRFIIFLFPFLVIGILIFFFLRILFPDWKPIEPIWPGLKARRIHTCAHIDGLRPGTVLFFNIDIKVKSTNSAIL